MYDRPVNRAQSFDDRVYYARAAGEDYSRGYVRDEYII